MLVDMWFRAWTLLLYESCSCLALCFLCSAPPFPSILQMGALLTNDPLNLGYYLSHIISAKHLNILISHHSPHFKIQIYWCVSISTPNHHTSLGPLHSLSFKLLRNPRVLFSQWIFLVSFIYSFIDGFILYLALIFNIFTPFFLPLILFLPYTRHQ